MKSVPRWFETMTSLPRPYLDWPERGRGMSNLANSRGLGGSQGTLDYTVKFCFSSKLVCHPRSHALLTWDTPGGCRK